MHTVQEEYVNCPIKDLLKNQNHTCIYPGTKINMNITYVNSIKYSTIEQILCLNIKFSNAYKHIRPKRPTLLLADSD